MDPWEPWFSLVLAAAAGLLIGLQREQAEGSDDERAGLEAVAGVRTYPVVALMGAVAALLGARFGPWLLAAGLAAIVALLAIAYADDLRHGRHRGLTSEFALALTYLLGALAAARGAIEPDRLRPVVVAALAVFVTWLLSAKASLHRAVRRLSPGDLVAALQFLALTVIALPLLPNRAYGPFDAFNPFHIGLMVVLIAGIGFVGYVAVRWLGPGRGIGLTGFVGGLVSSTAVTLAFSGRARREPRLAAACALAIVLASSVMVVRVALEVVVVNAALLDVLVFPLGGMLTGGLAVSAILYLRARVQERGVAERVEVANPVELRTALQFGVLYAVVLLVAKATEHHFGARGLYAASVLAGLTDMDAITLAVARMAREGLGDRVAATSILLAAASNTVVKAGLALTLGGWRLGRSVVFGFGVAIAAGALGLLAVR